MFKRTIYFLYLHYEKWFPINRGKYRIGKILSDTLGFAIYRREELDLLLSPIGLIDQKLIRHKDHDKIVKDAINNCLREGGGMLDIGANIGYFSLLASKNPSVQVYAFEPSKRELKRFYQHLFLNHCKNVFVFPIGLGPASCQMVLHVSDVANPGMNSFVECAVHARLDSEEVAVRPVHEVLTKTILHTVRLVKIDVEGFELDVLAGFDLVMCELRRAEFIVEISPELLSQRGQAPQDIYRFFEQFGFAPKHGMRDKFQYDEAFTYRNLNTA